MKIKKNKQKKIFKNEKQRKDIVLCYVAYSYIDSYLRDEGLVEVKKNKVFITEKAQKKKNFWIIKHMVILEKMIQVMLDSNKVKVEFNGNSTIQADMVINEANRVLKMAYSEMDNNENIFVDMFGLILLISWQEDIKMKEIVVNIDTKFVADYINNKDEIASQNEEMNKIVLSTMKLADKFIKHLYEGKWEK